MCEAVSGGDRQIAGWHRQTVHNLCLDVERRQVWQHVVEPARQPLRGARVDDALEVAQVRVEVPDDVEAEGQRRREERRRKGGEEQRDGGNEHQLDEDQEQRLEERRRSPARPSPIERAPARSRSCRRARRRAAVMTATLTARVSTSPAPTQDELRAGDWLGEQRVDAATLDLFRHEADANEDGDEEAEDRGRRQSEILDDLHVLPGGELPERDTTRQSAEPQRRPGCRGPGPGPTRGTR